MKRVLFSLIFTMAAYGHAWAVSIDEARQLLNDGLYDEAISMAQQMETAESLTLAAETLSAKVMLGYVDDLNDSARQARRWAQEAVMLAPQSREAQVQYALAYGFETRTSSPFRAWRKKLPEKTLAAIMHVRTHYPEDPRGDALLGAWHLGIVRKAGSKNGRKWYNASEVEGIDWYESALISNPDDIVVAGNFAITILGLNREKYASRARDIITDMQLITPKNAVELEVKNRMVGLLDKFDDEAALDMAIAELLDE